MTNQTQFLECFLTLFTNFFERLTQMPTVSLCMIVKNEQDVLERAVLSAQGLYDELIIVDTGSTDNTVEIAGKYTDKVYFFKWENDFAKARNYAFSLAKCDYIMWLDADDVITDDNRKQIAGIIEKLDPTVDIVMLKYYVAFDSNGNPTFEYYRERIIKNDKKHLFEGEVHEAVPLWGNIRYFDAAIWHKKIKENEPQRNLKIYTQLIEKGKIFNARQTYYYARELYYNRRFSDSLDAFNRLFLMDEAYIENLIDACKMAAYDLYALQKNDEALQMLFKSFTFDIPRADICCEIGKHFFDRSKYETAVYWYSRALECNKDKNGGFMNRDCFGYLPYIQLCVCLYRLGNIEAAEKYNAYALNIKPDDSHALKNAEFFKSLKTQQ